MAEQMSVGITLLGGGIVGGGVAKILTEQRELLKARTGVTFDLRHVIDKEVQRRRNELPKGLNIHNDAGAAIDDPDVQIVVELFGGTTAADELIRRALSVGKAIVTANKSLLSLRGPELFALARKHNTSISFEASAGGGVPIIHALVRSLVADRIEALVGIVNGTCNVILTRMTRNRWSYAEALKEAQAKGFAEADPTLDVSGRDAAQKLALLASLAFNVRVAESDIYVEGIDKLQKPDIEFARELGYVIKLLAIAERTDGDRLTLRVHPTLVHADDVLAEVSDSFNAISVYGRALGHALFYGRGAGQMPTASAVVSDIVAAALGTAKIDFQQLQIYPDTTPSASVAPTQELKSRYYLRLMAKDEPGVLAQVTRALGDQGISLSAIHQREADHRQLVPVVITTHMANEGSIRAAVKTIDALPTIGAATVMLRVMDPPREQS
jgi:homoserine dehydrogenase